MEEKQKTAGELRREALLYQPKNGYDRLSAQDEADMKSYCEDYKKFLRAGSSDHPIELLKIAGVDMASPQAVADTVEEFETTLEELEKLL